jgi:hypothetical protein
MSLTRRSFGLAALGAIFLPALPEQTSFLVDDSRNRLVTDMGRLTTSAPRMSWVPFVESFLVLALGAAPALAQVFPIIRAC